jgi:hypothetical protein
MINRLHEQARLPGGLASRHCSDDTIVAARPGAAGRAPETK